MGFVLFFVPGCIAAIKLLLRRTLVLHQKTQHLNFKISQLQNFKMISVQNVQVSDTTGDATCTKARKKII
jgi:hypothetical protein